MDKGSKWDFNAPKFWDLAEKSDMRRLSDTWFSKDTISPASFQRQILSLQPIFPFGFDYLHKKKLFSSRIKEKRTSSPPDNRKSTELDKLYPLEQETSTSSPFHLQTAASQSIYSNDSIDQPKSSNTLLLSSKLTVTKSTSLTLPTTTIAPLIPTHNPITVEMGRNRVYEEEEEEEVVDFEDMHKPKKGESLETAEESEVKRKYVYMNYDRMYETIKKAKLVLEESRHKSEQWRFKKKTV